MDKNKIQIAITAVLAVILIIVSINSCHRIKSKISPANTPAAKPAGILESHPSAAPVTSGRETSSEYAQAASFEWLRDPFTDKIYLSEKADIDLKLSGILWDEKNPSAIISDKIVNEGDTIGKYTVFRIREESVILNDGLKNVELIIGK